jgi:lipopolysaccharide biosynthesis protein
MARKKVLCVFAHYDRTNMVAPYVLYYLYSLRSIVDHIAFVSTSDLSGSDLEGVGRICDNVILRENSGYDFCSYRLGLQSVDFLSFEQIVLCNDSVYGPMMKLDSVIKSASEEMWDFWGITESFNPEYHVQSYFMVFQRNVVQSTVFSMFWEQVVALDDKRDVIEKYEVGLSKCLRAAGFQAGAWFPASKMTGIGRIFRYPRHYFEMFYSRWADPSLYIGLLKHGSLSSGVNPSHYEWEHMLTSGRSVFLKVALIGGETTVYYDLDQLLGLIEEHTAYPIELIKNNMKRN